MSKCDAKLCIRVAGVGRAGATSTVTTWGSVTNQVLALREHLIGEQVTTMVRTRAREIQRLEKLLEDAGIKLSSVASDITGVSGRAILEALIDGQRDPAELAGLAKRRLRSKIPALTEALTEALTGRFSDHHAFLARLHLDLIDQHSHAVDELTARIEVVMEPFRGARDLMISIPGISTAVADVAIAETGADMTRFPTAGHLASWAGTLCVPSDSPRSGALGGRHFSWALRTACRPYGVAAGGGGRARVRGCPSSPPRPVHQHPWALP